MRVHQVFVSLGLRHLCVVDAWNRAVGIITRKDLDKAAGSGSWRRNPVFASQDRCADSSSKAVRPGLPHHTACVLSLLSIVTSTCCSCLLTCPFC